MFRIFSNMQVKMLRATNTLPCVGKIKKKSAVSRFKFKFEFPANNVVPILYDRKPLY